MKKNKWKRLLSAFLAVLTTVTSFNFSFINVQAKTENLTLYYASVINTGAITEFGSSYNHGRVMYGEIDGNAAYCMNYGESADGGQSMSSSSSMDTPLSTSEKKQLLYCMYYGHSRTGSGTPSNKESNEFIATQAMIWIITEGLWGNSSADSAAKKICDSAPSATDSNAYYNSLKTKMKNALDQEIPSFTKSTANAATTIELEWNEDNNRFEKTVTDSNKVLGDFSISVSGISKSVDGNKVTFYTKNVVSTAQTAKFTSDNGTVEITGSCVYWTVNKSGYQEFVSDVPDADPITAYLKIKTEDLGYGELYKKDESSGVALAGAEYGIYKDSSCTNLVEKLTTNNSGYAKSSALTVGTYYMKEIKAPNKYVISTKVHTLAVKAGQTTTINATDKEQLGAINIYKEGEVLTGWNGSSFIYEKKRLPGATFKVTAGADIYKADGTKKYSSGATIATNLKTGSDGMVLLSDLHLGTYVVTETASIDGYTINTNPQTVVIAYKDQTVTVQYESTTILNARQKAEVSVLKRDSKTKNPLVVGKYSIYADNDIKNYNGTVIANKGTLLQTVTTGGDGKAAFTVDLPIANSYYVSETQAPNLYLRNQSDVYRFTFSYLTPTTAKATFSHTFENDRVTAKIHLYKQDKETGLAIPQGDASLQGAVYGLYAREDIVHPDGATGTLYRANELVAKLTTDKNAEAEIKDLYLGKYYVKEITPPEGYNIDTEEHDVNCNYEGDLVAEVARSTTSKEQVYKQPFQLIKVSDNGTDSEAPLLEGAGFTAYLKSALPVKANGTYDFQKATPVVIGENGETTIYTDKKGYLKSIPIPYGTYIVVESVTPHNLTTIQPFTVKVTEHKPNEPQVWRVFLDREFKAKLQIVKKDAKTTRTVLVPNAEFKIYNLDKKEYVSQYTTYPTVVKHTSFFTDKDGYLILPEFLPLGNYRIEEVAAPDGYTVNQNYVLFAVDTNTAYEIHGETQEVIITMDYVDEPVVGELTVEKKGEVLEGYEDGNFIYRERGLAGAEFEVYAAEDIYTNDYQVDEMGKRYKYYNEGDLIKTLVTGKNGKATLTNLPLGNYRIVETKAPDGYVLNEEEQTVTFVYVDDKTPVIYQTNTFTNDRQKARLSVEKLDGETGLPIAGAAFGLYNTEDIENVDGTVIVEADTLIETAVSDTNGMVTFLTDLPFGEYYAKEIEAPLGYVSSDETVEFEFEYEGQETEAVELVHEFENVPTTLEITKTDLTSGVELSGATLSVIDMDDNVVDTWTSEAGEPHVIQRLHVGETYTLREEFAPYGYLQAEEIEFTVEDTEETQALEMKDGVPTGTIVINKDGEFLTDVSLAKDKWYDFLFQYFRKSLAGVEFEVYAAEDIVSPDGLDEIYYEQDELVETIVTNDKGVAVLEGLPLGKYYLVETKTLEGFVLDDTPIEADVSYIDQNTPIVYAGMNVTNERQKVKISIIKTDSETDEPLYGAVFGLYAKEDMVNAEGTVVVQKDTLIEKAVTGEDGTCTIFNDLPLGLYYIKEIEAPKGYVSTDKVVEIDASYQEDDMEVLEFEAEFENAPTKTLISKTDITGKQEVPGATLTIIGEDGKVIEKWVSGKKPHLIERLPVGKYTLREELAPKGYTVASDVAFEVTDTGEVQKVSMKDETTKGKVVIHKVDKDTKKPLAGVEFELRDKDGKVLETLKTDKKGYAESKEYAIGSYEKGKFQKSLTYTLVETKAADGYLLDKTSHKIEFEWKDVTEPVIEVVKKLTNQKIPTTPKTGDERNPLPWVVLFVLSVTGLGILTVKKRKKKAGKGEA